MNDEMYYSYDESYYYTDYNHPEAPDFKYCECGKLITDCKNSYEHLSKGY